MVFSSSLFIFLFLPIVIVGYFTSNEKFRNLWLLMASLFFYSWGEPKYILMMVFSIIINFLFGIALEKFNSSQLVRKMILICACALDVGLLFLFKYLDFFIENVSLVSGKSFLPIGLTLPVGISFYTFQTLSYVIDVFRREVKAQRNVFYLGLYISFFPQLIAGPIVRYSDIQKQIVNRKIYCDKLYTGIMRFMTGFVKKVLIADTVAGAADWAFSLQGLSAPTAWIGMIAYSLQIYFDFSGYSDMAIGIGKIFGFDFNENFNYPYISCSIKEFWRRWHISLSTWFRDYIYIPLGGSRCGKIKVYRNLMIVFFLTGFWHGASWNFILWGMYYGVFLIMERVFLGGILNKIPKLMQHLYALLVVGVGWIFFRAATIGDALSYIKSLLVFNSEGVKQLIIGITKEQLFFIVAGIVFSSPLIVYLCDKLKVKNWMKDIAVIVMFLVAIMYMVGSGFSPFLYFRF